MSNLNMSCGLGDGESFSLLERVCLKGLENVFVDLG